MATKKDAPAAPAVEYIARAGGWGLTPAGVWVALDGDAAPIPPTVAELEN